MPSDKKKRPSPFDPTQYSNKARELDAQLLAATQGLAHALLERLLVDHDLLVYQTYANSVAVRRLHYNDHGPVHMRITALNAIRIMRHLVAKGIEMSLQSEQLGNAADSELAILFASLLHDVGMGVTRSRHEWHSIRIADSFLSKYLPEFYPHDSAKQCILRALVHELIVGHMGNEIVHSVEAGIVMVADGTDMTHGRSRIVGMLLKDGEVGDMHKHSADAVRAVTISAGVVKPVLISVDMSDYAGVFQVEEVLLPKVTASPIKDHLEIRVNVQDQPTRYYLQ